MYYCYLSTLFMIFDFNFVSPPIWFLLNLKVGSNPFYNYFLSHSQSSVLALEESALDVDQVDNLIKFCPTKEEMEMLKVGHGKECFVVLYIQEILNSMCKTFNLGYVETNLRIICCCFVTISPADSVFRVTKGRKIN